MPAVGDRVLAQWPTEVEWWYPGVVVAAQPGRVFVQFDDGDRSAVADDRTATLGRVAAGLRVQGRFQGGRGFFPGHVTARTGDAIHIAYDDGDEEWTSVAMVRVHESDL